MISNIRTIQSFQPNLQDTSTQTSLNIINEGHSLDVSLRN